MRYLKYGCKDNETGQVESRFFDESHYKEISEPLSDLGLPEIQALRLINKWNKMTDRFKYIL